MSSTHDHAGTNGNGNGMVDAPKRLYFPLLQLVLVAGSVSGGAIYLNDRFNTIDRKFDQVQNKLQVIDEKVANPVTMEKLRNYFALLKAYNPTLNIPSLE